jgi:hypothetical protein
VECSFAAGSADSTGQAQVVNEVPMRPPKPHIANRVFSFLVPA